MLCALDAAAADAEPPPAGEIGLYSAGQAIRGRKLYERYCTSCHGAKLEGNPGAPLAGPAFLSRWADGQHTLDDLFYIIRTLMPYNEPGKLTKQQYADILAYVLEVNGFAAGGEDLAPSPVALKKVTLQPR